MLSPASRGNFTNIFKSTDKTAEHIIHYGCFYGKDKKIDEKMRYTNTFVYIDDSGAYIMRWKIQCIEAFPAG
jgi:hypothetical protein